MFFVLNMSSKFFLHSATSILVSTGSTRNGYDTDYGILNLRNICTQDSCNPKFHFNNHSCKQDSSYIRTRFLQRSKKHFCSTNCSSCCKFQATYEPVQGITTWDIYNTRITGDLIRHLIQLPEFGFGVNCSGRIICGSGWNDIIHFYRNPELDVSTQDDTTTSERIVSTNVRN